MLILLSLIFYFPVGAQTINGLPDPRIIGGKEVPPDTFPWMIALVYRDEPDIYQGQFCGGSLIHPNWVLTASHCIHDKSSEIDAVLGTNDLTSPPGEYERIEVVEIIEHPGYNHFTMNNDIALLRLSRPSRQTPISSLITPANAFILAPPGKIVTITGWGDTDIKPWRTDFPELLMQVDLPIVSNANCRRVYKWKVTGNMLCAGSEEGGKDSCNGDSGGPLIVEDGHGGYAQAGIVSWGEGCGRADYYGVNTRVSKYIDWIAQWVELNQDCGDYNHDGVVNQKDLLEMGVSCLDVLQTWTMNCWLPKEECGDYDGNGDINQKDLRSKRLDLIRELKDWITKCRRQENIDAQTQSIMDDFEDIFLK